MSHVYAIRVNMYGMCGTNVMLSVEQCAHLNPMETPMVCVALLLKPQSLFYYNTT